jgi:hypothetical protein
MPGDLTERFFSVSNPDDSEQNVDRLTKRYVADVRMMSGVRKKIGVDFLNAAIAESRKMARTTSKRDVLENQKFCVNAEGIGDAYLHKRDKPFKNILDKSEDIHTFLPGYATGDRYTLILSMLTSPKLRVAIAYTKGEEKEEQAATEAYAILRDSLEKSGDTDPTARISLLEFHNPGSMTLKEAREALDHPDVRTCFDLKKGAATPLANTSAGEHVFHISVTTELIARQFRHATPGERAALCQGVRNKLNMLVDPQNRKIIDKLVRDVVQEQNIQKGSVALWVADRDNPNDREAQGISRPAMLELIAHALEKSGKPVFFIADTYINKAKDMDGNEVVVNRHPYRPKLRPDIGRFWGAKLEGEPVLAKREHQWYFMDRLLTETGGGLVGVRSGALEPLALMGHNIVFLEHKNMFTPERHASWQGIIPYHRMRIEHTAGYMDMQTETLRDNLVDHLVTDNLRIKHGVGQPGERSASELIAAVREKGNTSDQQSKLAEITHDIHSGVMSTSELHLLVEMVRTGKPALRAAEDMWLRNIGSRTPDL